MTHSIIQDSDLVKGRKPLEAENRVNLLDRHQVKLAKKLNELEFGRKAVSIWQTGNADRADWLMRQRDYLAQWDEFLDNEDVATGPWAEASNIHLPLTLTACRAVHARMYAALLGVQPPFVAKPQTDADTVAQPMVDGVMAYTLREYMNNNQGVEEVVDKWLWNWITTGVGLLKTRWDRKFTRLVDVVEKQVPDIEIDAEGNQTRVIKVVEQEQTVTKKLFDGPAVDIILPEDLLIVGGDGNVHDADVIQHRYYHTRSELYALADQGIFDIDVVEEILSGGNDSESTDQSSNIKLDRERNSGIIQSNTPADNDKFEILETYAKVDVNDDGMDEDIICWVHKNSSKVLRGTYLHRIYKGGQVPFIKIDFLKRQGQTYGMGIPEIIYPLQREIDALHNIRMDYGVLSTMPFGFVRSTSVNAAQMDLAPGKLIPLNDPQNDVFFPNLGTRTAFLEGEEANLLAHVERLTAISDINLGRVGGQGAARTATGVSALVSENNANLDIFIKRMQRGWKQLLRLLFQLLQQRLPADKWIRICGEDGKMYPFRIRKDDIQFNYDFDIDANSVNSNRAITREIAQQTMNLVMNPLLIQMGITTPENMYEAVKNFLVALDIKDYSRYISKPSDMDVFLSPEQEINRLMRNIEVPVHPAQKHESFLKYAEQIFNNDEWLGTLSTEQAQRIAAQADKHMQMMQAVAAQQAQQDQRAQQQINAQGAGAQTASIGPNNPSPQG